MPRLDGNHWNFFDIEALKEFAYCQMEETNVFRSRGPRKLVQEQASKITTGTMRSFLEFTFGITVAPFVFPWPMHPSR